MDAIEYGETIYKLYRENYGDTHRQMSHVLKELIHSLEKQEKQYRMRKNNAEANKMEKRRAELMKEYIRLCNSAL